jgi:carbon monoxide dehydrogenase subunit G
MSEVRIADEIRVEAPIAAVWRAIEDPVVHARWHPFVTGIAGEHGLDQVRTCQVLVGTKQGETRERCVELQDGKRITWLIEEDSTGFGRMASGWHAGFALAPHDGATSITAESTFAPNNLLVRAMLPLIRRKFHHTQRAILRALKDSLDAEQRTASL